MKNIVLHNSEILIGENFRNLNQYLQNYQTIVVLSDETVFRLYGNDFNHFPTILIEKGESNKTLKTVDKIIDQLLDIGADRKTFLLGIGGGIVCDIAGFVASIYMRGIKFGFVSTTLLSQVDASIGGKNGVNFNRYKNIIGTFNQPQFVICDVSMLQTLPNREFMAGFSEIIKAGIIKNYDLLEDLSRNYEHYLEYNTNKLENIIHEALLVKSGIVLQDELENGVRKYLNLGHSFGHAIENISQNYLHGEAISIGLIMAIDATQYCFSDQKPYLRRETLIKLLNKFNLPTTFSIDPDLFAYAMFKDKKKEGETIELVLMGREKNTFRLKKLTFEELLKLLSHLQTLQ